MNDSLGQVWTPTALANQIASQLELRGPRNLAVLDPCSGPGTFGSALARSGRDFRYVYVERDPKLFEQTMRMVSELQLSGEGHLADYLAIHKSLGKFDAVVMNPPYVRHELIEAGDKELYRSMFDKEVRRGLDGRANLMAYFCLAALSNLRVGGKAIFVLYGGYKFTRYGQFLDTFFRNNLEDLSVRTIPTPFDGVLVDAVVVSGIKRQAVLSDNQPATQEAETGMIRLDSVFDVQRGTAIPSRKDFTVLRTNEAISSNEVEILLKSTRDNLSSPNSNARILLTHENYTGKIRLKTGEMAFNYYFRSSPRHLWIDSRFPISDNYYLLNKRIDTSSDLWWLLLNSEKIRQQIYSLGREQGSGLRKLQLFEYRSILVPDLSLLRKSTLRRFASIAKTLIIERAQDEKVSKAAESFAQTIRKETGLWSS